MGSEGEYRHQVHVFFFPFTALGHMIVMADMAKLFAMCGCKSTVIASASHDPVLSKLIRKTKDSGHDIEVAVVRPPPMQQEHDDFRSARILDM